MKTTSPPHPRMARATLALVAGAALSLALVAGTALAWAQPVLQPLCAPDENHYSWELTLSPEPDYWIQFSWSSDFSNAWSVNFGSSGAHDFDTDRGGATLYARWLHDMAKKTSAAADGELCFQPTPSATPTPTPEESVSAEPTPTPTPTPEESVSAEPTPTPEQSVSEEPTPTPTPEQSVSEEPTPTPTPEGSVEGGTGTPAPSLPDSAISASAGSNPAPTVIFGLILLLSLLALARMNVVATSRRR